MKLTKVTRISDGEVKSRFGQSGCVSKIGNLSRVPKINQYDEDVRVCMDAHVLAAVLNCKCAHCMIDCTHQLPGISSTRQRDVSPRSRACRVFEIL